MALLSVAGLTVSFPGPNGTLRAVRGIDLRVAAGETVCLVGESGCGKSLSCLAMLGLLPRGAERTATTLRFDGDDLLTLPERRLRDLRGDRIAMIFQDPMTALNPAYTIGDQLTEIYHRHRRASRREAEDRAVHLLERVGITAARARLAQYPHQFSGGLRQRVVIAMALMCEPALLIADEPTTALDVTIQAQILHLLKELQRETGVALILVTHDLGIVARMADRVVVMYAGAVVETASASTLFNTPKHPYTQGLLNCIPVPGRTARGNRLGAIPGVVPSLVGTVNGCAFRTRCPIAQAGCADSIPWRETAGTDHRWHCLADSAPTRHTETGA